MIVSELKPWSEIQGYLANDKKVFILGCKGCAEVSKTGDEATVLATKQKLEQEGKAVTGWAVADFLCDRAQIKFKLLPFRSQVEAADSILVMTCGIGIQAAAAVIDKVCHPATNTINLGGARGEWPGAERCRQCGECLLEYTGGICPLTNCSKMLINGQCGGSKNGRCEVEPDVRPCGWQLIYERLEKLGRLDYMKDVVRIKNWNKMQPPPSLRATIKWSIDQVELVPTAATAKEVAKK
ncbi:MAG: methylenetetrahydrofolate reductase C-terminal domain-containing protein [Dehalococcoidia bacterium]|nr:methylenetetrahydrofolate reductase C-terminal domain-containing protein [Dehalococcoidia bacterium]